MKPASFAVAALSFLSALLGSRGVLEAQGGGYTLSASPSSCPSGTRVRVSWTTPAGANRFRDWVALVKVGEPVTNHGMWDFTAGRDNADGPATGSLTFVAPRLQGQYEWHYFPNGNYTSVASTPFTVSGTGPTPYSLTVSPSSVPRGGSFTVSWTAPADVSRMLDWIGIYVPGTGDNQFWGGFAGPFWQYTGGSTSGSVTLPAPDVDGTYQFRYLANDSFMSMVASSPVTVGIAPPPPQGDTDGDAMPDVWELQFDLNPNSAADASGDLDGDGITNLQEYQGGTDPTQAGPGPSGGSGREGREGCGATGAEAILMLALTAIIFRTYFVRSRIVNG